MVELMATWRDEERSAAQTAVDFFECHLRHYKGAAAGRPFLLELWEESIIRQLFGRLRPDGSRRYRTCYIEVPRKNGKSTIAAGIALYLFVADGEAGPEVYSAAGDRGQARIVFKAALAMTMRSRYVAERVVAFKHSLETLDSTGEYRALSSDADLQHGLDVHGAVVDELHVHPTRDLGDVLTTGTGARRQPLVVAITTAGHDQHTICWEMHEYARRVIAGEIRDDSFFGAIYAADPDDDWTSEETWRKANPNLGVSVSLDYLRQECAKAQTSPAYENTFRRLHLNQWTSQDVRWLPMDRWNECGACIDEKQLEGEVCFAGLDLSSTTDITAFVMVFPSADGLFRVVPRLWIPSADLAQRAKRDGVPYAQWASAGYIRLMDGEVIDLSQVRSQIVDDCGRFQVREIAYDRWGASSLSQELDALGIQVIPFGQGFASMSSPTKDLLTLVLGRRIVHGGHPVMRWMADATEVRQDPAGNIKPVKPDRRKSAKRIDGIVAMIMALDRAQRHMAGCVPGAKAKGRSVYEDRGLVVI